jgi:hypothetical protein
MNADAPMLRQRLLREIRAAKRYAVVRAWLPLLPISGVVFAVASGRLGIPDAAVATGRVAALILVGVAFVAARRALAAVEAEGFAGIAKRLSDTVADVDLLAAAAWLLTVPEQGKLAPLVTGVAEERVRTLPVRAPRVVDARAAGFVALAVLSVLATVWMFPENGGLGTRLAAQAASLFGRGSAAEVVEDPRLNRRPRVVTREPAPPPPDVAITVVSDRRIDALGAPIELTFALDVKRAPDVDIPIDVRLGIS